MEEALNTPPFRGPPRGPRPNRFQAPPEAHRINARIVAREVRVISDGGEQLGIMSVRDALAVAEGAGLDLVEVAPNANPPVCRVMDYGKFKYQEQKKEAQARKKQKDMVIKELRIRYRTDDGDLNVKLKQAREFLAEGDKVKFSMRFKGREAMYVDLGGKKLDEIIKALEDIAIVDERSPTRGNNIFVQLAPGKPGQKLGPQPAPISKGSFLPPNAIMPGAGQPAPAASASQPAQASEQKSGQPQKHGAGFVVQKKV